MIEAQKDTVPRLFQLVPHMRAQLMGMRDGTTLEEARRRYIGTVDQLVAQGLGRRTASRVGDRDAFWSPTVDVLDEAMRLGFVEKQPLPSSRKFLDSHRDTRHLLTLPGAQVAEYAQHNVPKFYDLLTTAVYGSHLYFRQLISLLSDRPVHCPEVTEGEVEEARQNKHGLEYWSEVAFERLQDCGDQLAEKEDVRESLRHTVRRRFGSQPPESKPLAEALNDALANLALKARGLNIGATDLNILKSWGAQLRVLDQSRYVPEYPRANTIWLSADLQDTEPKILRHELRDFEQQVANALLSAYRSIGDASESRLSAPYVPIFRVRAAAAFQCRVTRALVDLVIEKLMLGSIPDFPNRMLLHLGTTRQPVSEPVYRRGGMRRYEMTIVSS